MTARTHDEAHHLYHAIMADRGMNPIRPLSKSLLYLRLLNGKDPLLIPPPLAYSYPWYEVVESDNTLQVEEPKPYSGHPNVDNAVSIFQSIWKVISRNEDELQVTYPGWDAKGFKWKVWQEQVSANKSQGKLLCHHDPQKKYLATQEDLEAESLYHATQWRKELSIVANHSPEEALALLANTVLQDGSSKSTSLKWFSKAYAKQALGRHTETLNERYKLGIPSTPSEDEVRQYASKESAMLLGDQWCVMNGLLYCRVWKMKRIFPERVSKEFYLDTKDFV